LSEAKVRIVWSTEELANLKRIIESCKSHEEALANIRQKFPELTVDAFDRCVRRCLGIGSLRKYYQDRVAAYATPRVQAPDLRILRTAPQAEDVEIPVTVDLSETGSVEDDRKVHRLQQENASLLSAKKRLLDQLGERDQQIAALTNLGTSQPPPIVAPRGRGESKRRLATPIMLLSDWHVEEPVDPAKVNGLNEYNLDIAEKCIDRCADAFEWLTRDPRFDMREAVIWLGGDLYSGYIHAELQESNFLSPVKACVWLQDRIEAMLRRILAETNFERIIVPCNDGNHGRLTQKMRISTRTANSLEWFLYKTLAKKFEGEPRIQFQIADGEWNFVDVFNHTIGFFHGDSVRYQGGVGGLLIPMRKALNEMRKYRKVDSFAFGHFHQYLPLPEMTANGSMIGLGPYSMSIKAAPEPRQQSFFLIDSEKGKCMSAPIWL
jgi:hypothetical protein